MTIEHRGWRKESGHGQDHSALNLCDVDSLQVDGGALAGACLNGGIPVDLNTAHTGSTLRWEDLDFLFFLDASGDQRTCRDGAETFHRETTVHRQTKDIGIVFTCHFRDIVAQRLNHFRNAFSSLRTYAQYQRMLQK